MHMKVSVTLFQQAGDMDKIQIEEIENRDHFSYIDYQNCSCEITIQEKQFHLKRIASDHQMNLYLGESSYAQIETEEGKIYFETKTVDFNFNSDILVIRYIINDEERVIEIKYY